MGAKRYVSGCAHPCCTHLSNRRLANRSTVPDLRGALLNRRWIPGRLLDALLVVLPGRRIEDRNPEYHYPDCNEQSNDAEHDPGH